VTAPIPGDPVYLGSFLSNTHWYGIVGDGETPAMQVATMEAVGQDAVIALDALKGDKGDKGDPADTVKMQWDSDIDDVSDLPTASAANGFTRELTADDVGFGWWIDSLVYVWTGDHYIAKQMGSQGQTGMTPDISFTMELIDPEDESSVEESGTVNNPVLHFKIAAPRGPEGPASAILLASDYDDSQLPENGQVLTWEEDPDFQLAGCGRHLISPPAIPASTPSPSRCSRTSPVSRNDKRSCPTRWRHRTTTTCRWCRGTSKRSAWSSTPTL
jgi:hypothetical protein